jgi:hypothetical protein
MKGVFVIAVLVAGAWWYFQDEPPPTVATEQVLDDLANERGLRWAIYRDGVEVVLDQHEPATIIVEKGEATIATGDWRASVTLANVREIVCERRFHHWPEPGWVELFVSVREGPDDEDGFADEMFVVRFPEEREASMRSICDRHGLRRDGDW